MNAVLSKSKPRTHAHTHVSSHRRMQYSVDKQKHQSTYWLWARQFLLQTRPNDGNQLSAEGPWRSNFAPTRVLGNFNFFCRATTIHRQCTIARV